MPRKNTLSADYPQAVLQQIEQLAQNIAIARKRRGESQAQWARKLGISQPTMARIERGDPSVAMASYVMCMWLVNQASGLAELISPQRDHAALENEVAKVRATPRFGKQLNPNIPAANLQAWSTHPGSSSSIRHPSLTGTNRFSEPAPPDTVPSDDVRKSLARTAKLPDGPASSAASGLAALLAGSDPKKK